MDDERGAVYLRTTTDASEVRTAANAVQVQQQALPAMGASVRQAPILKTLEDMYNNLNLPILRLALGLLCAVILIYGLYHEIAPGIYRLPYTDFSSFLKAALDVRHGADPYVPAVAWLKQYSPTGTGALFATKSYVYPPFFALLLSPLTFLPARLALNLWDTANLVFIVGSIYAALRVAGKRPSLLSLLVLASIFSLTAPVRKEWSLGQTDIFLLFLICCAFWARQADRRTLAGLLLALACVTKPTFIVLVLFLLWKREFKFAAVTFVTFLGLLLAPFLWLGGQTWHDQLAVWNFWSNQYVAYAQNISPKGVLTRLFTVNPVVRPLVAAPALVTVLWLLCVVAVLLFTVAVVPPRPLQRNTRTLLEIGIVISALFLASPLTEWPYLLVLAIPLLACYCWLADGNWRSPNASLLLIGVVVLVLLLLEPLSTIQYYFVGHLNTSSVRADLFVLLEPAYLYGLILAVVLQFHAMALIAQRPTMAAVRQFLHDMPSLASQWLKGAGDSVAVAPAEQPLRR